MTNGNNPTAPMVGDNPTLGGDSHSGMGSTGSTGTMGTTGGDTGSTTSSTESMRDQAKAKAAELKGQAGDLASQASAKARDAAAQGKTKAAGAVSSLAKLIEDTAPKVDERLGNQYGDYARTAATSVSDFAHTLESKDIDELVAQGKDFVKKNPAAAIGAAVVAGFVVARLFKGSSNVN